MKIDRWDSYFLRMAGCTRHMSKDPSSQIGAVIVKDRRVVATGYNGFPPGIADDDRLDDREKKYELVVHAELNALLYAGREARGATLYLWGFKGAPCINCAKHLAAAGIVRYVATGAPIPERWVESLQRAEAVLLEAGITFEYHDVGDVLARGCGPRETPQ